MNEKIIAQQLRLMGVKPALDGYTYLKVAIKKSYCDASYRRSITKRMYIEIAKEFGTTPSKVERAMRTAIEVAWSMGNEDLQCKVFGYTISVDKGKPTNGEFIAAMAEYLHEEFDNEDAVV